MRLSPDNGHSGVAYGLAAYLWWGCIIFYFKVTAHVAPVEVLCHRIIWSAVLLLVLLAGRRRLGMLVASFRDRVTLLTLCATTLVIAINWLTFIIAVAGDRILDTSLGYFINPLVSVVLGLLFLRERLTGRQWAGVLLAAIGVAVSGLHLGRLPATSLILAFSFGTYGLLRKRLDVDPVVGLAVETILLAPAALVFLAVQQSRGLMAFTNIDTTTDLWLLAAGPITALPLIWFAAAAQRLRLATVGILQYLVPTVTFVFAITIFDEAIGPMRLLSFTFIWVAIIIYTVDSIRNLRRHAPVEGADDGL